MRLEVRKPLTRSISISISIHIYLYLYMLLLLSHVVYRHIAWRAADDEFSRVDASPHTHIYIYIYLLSTNQSINQPIYLSINLYTGMSPGELPPPSSPSPPTPRPKAHPPFRLGRSPNGLDRWYHRLRKAQTVREGASSPEER